MPIYEYRCGKCRKISELLRPMGDTGKDLECPECGADQMEKIHSSFAAASTSSRSESMPCPAASTCGNSTGFG